MQQKINFDKTSPPLHQVTFVVLDIETTGGSTQSDAITEIGAVKVRGGEVIGEFQTLVNPETRIPIQIEVLTGITASMVVAAPKIQEVLPSFFEFLSGSILVAHNAKFDIGFLKSAAFRHGYEWPFPKALDTVHLAKVALGSDEVKNRKLATLSQRFGTKVQPSHRALADAQATVEVFHTLLERLGRMGVHALSDLEQITPKLPEHIRAKAKLADSIPNRPGCYLFKDAQETVLYVGVSQDLKNRVRSYFTRGEKRKYVRDAIAITASVSTVICATATEAKVRELRLIAKYRPSANRVARNPEKIWWMYFSSDKVPRLIISKIAPGIIQPALGPFTKKSVAEELRDFINTQFKLRDCKDALVNRPNHPGCIRGEMKHCSMPCQQESLTKYLAEVDKVNRAMLGESSCIVDLAENRMRQFSASERFEEAQKLKELIEAFNRAVNRIANIRKISAIPEFTSITKTQKDFEVHLIRFGRLVASGAVQREEQLSDLITVLKLSAEQVEPRGILPARALAGYDDAPSAIGEAELLMNLSDLSAWLNCGAEFLPPD